MKTNIKSWLSVIIHGVLVGIATLITFLQAGEKTAITLCVGGLVSLLTLVGVVWTTQRMFAKKSIALTAGSVVIKYALLGWILYYITQNLKMDVLWLGLGISLILPSLIIFGLLSEKGLTEDEVD